MADDLMIEVTGASKTAESAIDRVIKKITDLQAAFEKVAPSVSKFAEQMNSIASGSKGMQALKDISSGTDKTALAAKNAESKMAMYQSRLDRAAVSSERSKAALDKLAAAHLKAANAAAINAKNEEALNNVTYNGMPTTGHVYPEGSGTETEHTASGVGSFVSDVKSPSVATSNVDFATANFRQLSEYIDSLRPAISSMSESAQAEFEAIAQKILMLSQQIDNQRMLYHNLSEEAAKAAAAQGEGSNAYLGLEKRMLGADSAVQRLIDKQSELKDKLYETTVPAEELGNALNSAGDQAVASANKSKTAWESFSQMMEKMLVRIAAFKLYSAVITGLKEGIQDLAKQDSTVDYSISQITSSFNYLKDSIAVALIPTIKAITPIIVDVCNGLAEMNNQIAQLTAQLFNQGYVTKSKYTITEYADSLNKTATKAKKTVQELKNAVLGFDELNLLVDNSQNSSDIAAVVGNGIENPDRSSGALTGGNGIPSGKTTGRSGGGGPQESDDSNSLFKNNPFFTENRFDFSKWKAKFSEFGTNTVKVWNATGESLKYVWQKVCDFFPDTWNKFVTNWNKGVQNIKSAWEVTGDSIKFVWQKVCDFFPETWDKFVQHWNEGVDKVKFVWDITGDALKLTWQKVCDFFPDTWNKFVTNWNDGVNKVRDWWNNLCDSVKTKWNDAWDSVSSGWNHFKDDVSAGWNGIGDWFNDNVAPWFTWEKWSGLANDAIDALTYPFKNISWPQIKTPHVEWTSGGAQASGWIYDVLNTLHLPTQLPKLNVDWYANGGLFNAPSVIGIGEAGPEAALPLNDDVYSRISKGIQESGGSSSIDISKILERMDRLEEAIKNMHLALYTDDRQIAESANRGNKSIDRRYHSTALA